MATLKAIVIFFAAALVSAYFSIYLISLGALGLAGILVLVALI